MNLLEKQERDNIWAKHEKNAGFLLPQKFRDSVESRLGNSDRFLEDLNDSIPDYVDFFKACSPSRENGLANNTIKSKPKRKYRKCFERRFYLVDFVVKRGRNKKNNRIDWKRTVTEWNEANPSDTMTLPVLKAEYYRAMQESPLRLQYLITYVGEIAKVYSQTFQSDYLFWMPRYRPVVVKNYQEFVNEVIRMVKESEAIYPRSVFVNETIIRLCDTLLSTYNNIERPPFLKIESQLSEKEANHERPHNQKVQE